MRIELERGDIFFFYRPRVGVPKVKRLEDVQRFFFILHPGRGERLRERFHGWRFAPLDTPEWLDHERTELVLIGAARAAARELQIDLDPDEERIHDADLFEQLRIGANELATEPLRSGALE